MSDLDPVEVAARALCAESRSGIDHCTCNGNCGDAWKKFRNDAKIVLSAIETAGFRLVRREATEEMIAAYKGDGDLRTRNNISAVFDAAPTYGSPPATGDGE